MSRAEYQHLVEQIERSLRTLAKQSAMDESMKKSSVTFSKKDLLNELMEDEEEVMSRRGSEKMSKASKESRKEEFSPVDKFNMELLKDWESTRGLARRSCPPDPLPRTSRKPTDPR